ncbi:MAG TPA: peptidase E [Chloroflexota bacterium]|jgi:peptidase E
MSQRQRTIVAIGGTPARPDTIPPIADYLLDLTGKARAKVCFIPTAKGDQPEFILSLYSRIPAARAERSHLALFDRTVKDVREFLLGQDLIWVGGGNTANMLAVWRVHGVDRALREAWEAGIVLCGGSAGSLCWFECGTTDSFDLNQLAPLSDGLGFLPGSHCPHYGAEQRRPLYHRLIADGFPPGYAIDDDAAIRFVGSEVAEVVSARDGATAYRVERRDGRVVETPLEARRIGPPASAAGPIAGQPEPV